ncbi:ABC transporter ATP-binding protein [Cerasicoccus fimbriatus]|uniref:ABC transporter ATP-binding protein n=1 Tax=Cerasicoccus fimbriatus TaxID=3014554 RepID=UPI0022B4163F|nr:ABC transporter ATP-binding protein [Cerasicoccus sp. TK19100]
MSTATATSPTSSSTASDDVVLSIENLKTHFFTEEGQIPAVDGVSLKLKRGKVLAIVGESGCGKSVTSYSILRLIRSPGKIMDGKILFHSERRGETVDIAALDEKSDTLYQIRGGNISMIFQEPMTALSPVHTVGNQICEAILLHQNVTKEEARQKAIDMLISVGIPQPEERIDQYPHEMSGGMRQRVVIAMALVCDPEILIADEPTTALDVTLQAQILKLMRELQEKRNCSVVFITHDLGVVAQMADEVAVMYLGRVVETGSVRDILKNPAHPYTLSLLHSIPRNETLGGRLPTIKGSVPSLTQIPKGCPFHPRCPFAVPGKCDVGGPPDLLQWKEDRQAACVRLDEIHGNGKPTLQVEGGVDVTQSIKEEKVLLQVRNLCKHFPIYTKGLIRKQKGVLKAVDNVSFDLLRGETLGLVGESGSGKTTCARTILRALSATSGEAIFRSDLQNRDIDLTKLERKELKPLRKEMQMIFQDPFSSLNPRMTVGDIVAEPLVIHKLASGSTLEDMVVEMLKKVGLKPEHRQRYPHAFSGGQRQRIGIARALIMQPSLVVADEAVSALDVSVQAQVINLLADLQIEFGLTYLFVAHDLSVVRHICDRVAVMQGGKLVEFAESEALFENPQHPYTQKLLTAVPSLDPDERSW